MDLLNEKCLLEMKVEIWKSSWIYKSRMEGRVLAGEIHLGVVSIFMTFKPLNLDELAKGMSREHVDGGV